MLPSSPKILEQIALGRRVNTGRHLAHLNLFISNLKDRKQEVAKNSERGRPARLRKVGVDHKILLQQEKSAPIQEENFQNHSTSPPHKDSTKAPPGTRRSVAPCSTLAPRSNAAMCLSPAKYQRPIKPGGGRGRTRTLAPPAGAPNPARAGAAEELPWLTAPPYPG